MKFSTEAFFSVVAFGNTMVQQAKISGMRISHGRAV
jgi:hypothetical protein